MRDLDPQGQDGQENPEDVGLAVDGNPETGWRTSTYYRRADLGGLKDGVGLVVDLGGPREVDSPAADAYAARLRASSAWGGLFAAHHYTRYLGDLSGGQAIGRCLDRAFELDGRGIAFYDFAAIGKPKPYKDAYRARLDALGTSPEETERVVAEVKVAFGLNQALFEELGRDLPRWRRAA